MGQMLSGILMKWLVPGAVFALGVASPRAQDEQDAPVPVPEWPAPESETPSESTDPGVEPGGGTLIVNFDVKPPLPSLEEQETAGNLLDHLEAKDAEITRFSAGVQYTRVQALQGDIQVRRGMLYYQKRPNQNGRSVREFAVDFTTLIVDEVVRDEHSSWVFDGEWLVEKDYDRKQFVRRRIAAPGSDVDPLRLGSGSGTIPLPIGQRREDVERYFTPELVGALDGLVPDPESDEPDDDKGFRESVRTMGGSHGVEGVYQLKLTPIAGTDAAEDYRVIRLWYQKSTLLPLMSRAIDRKGDISTVQLLNVNTDAAIPEGAISTGVPDGGAGWEVHEDSRLFEEG